MSDLKISQLTGATTPLAGTEVLPIVQSGSTKQVSVANLTAGRSLSVSSLTATGNIGAANMSVSDSNWIGWGNYNSRFTGSGGGPINVVTNSATAGTWDTNQNYTFYVGNLIQGTAAKGVNFTANTPRSGMTSQLLNWYEEGTFTPTLTGSNTAITLTYTTQTGRYTRVGRLVTVTAYVQVNTISAAGSGFLILNTGLWNSDGTPAVGAVTLGKVTYTSFASAQMRGAGSASLVFYSSSTAGAPAIINATDVVNGSEIYVTITYIAA